MSKQRKKLAAPSAPSGQTLAQLNEAIKLHRAGKHTQALPIAQRALARNPKLAEAHHILTAILISLGDTERARYHATQSIAIDPDRAEFHAALANVCATERAYEQSIPHYERALELDAQLPDAINGLGVACKESGRFAQSVILLDKLLELQPDNQDAIVNRALLDTSAGRSCDAVSRLADASKRFPKNPILHDQLALASSYDDTLTPEQAFAFHKQYGQVLRTHIRPRAMHANSPDPDRRLRVGYISAEFRQHSNSYFLAPILDNHNKDNCDIFLYSTNGYSDATTDRLKSAADHWRLFKSNELRAIIDKIVEDKIDILVELTGHFASNNLPILAAKPAPVQITYLGYANTTGLDTIDYRIIDHITDPAPAADTINTESLIRLDGCFLTYEPTPDLPPTRDPENRPFTFASFNDLKKLTPSAVQAWSSILKANPDTRLLLKNTQLDHDELKAEITSRFTQQGIDPDRVQTVGRIESMRDHLDLYNEVDLALDTFPYTGTTTTCEALAMGVPVLTLVGSAHAGRVSASILQTINRPDLCADTLDQYIASATAFANKPKPTADDRAALRAAMLDSPLCDAASFVPKLEDAYRQAWTDWCSTNGAPR